jgi:predicted transcriptional regulator
VVGYFTVSAIEAAPPETLWQRFGGVGLVTKERFVEYFSGLEIGYAIIIGTVVKFSQPRRLQELNGHGLPPQSFSYLNPDRARRVLGPGTSHAG